MTDHHPTTRVSAVSYSSWLDAIDELPLEEQVYAFRAVYMYLHRGVEPPADYPLTARVIFKMAKPQIDKNTERYDNGCSGGRPKSVKAGELRRKKQAGSGELSIDYGGSEGANCLSAGELQEKKQVAQERKTIGYGPEKPNDNEDEDEDVDVYEDVDEDDDASTLSRRLPSRKEKFTDKDAVEVLLYYNRSLHASGARLAEAKGRSERRLRSITARLREYGRDGVRTVIDKAMASDFLNHVMRNGPADLDWIMGPEHFMRVLEGKYDNRDDKDVYERTEQTNDGRGDRNIDTMQRLLARNVPEH
ncbi:MAG: DUF6291 domain-containing protein [Prevotella sp.]|nr:DUF6291 domain-containing protein [Prevotella sp.]